MQLLLQAQLPRVLSWHLTHARRPRRHRPALRAQTKRRSKQRQLHEGGRGESMEAGTPLLGLKSTASGKDLLPISMSGAGVIASGGSHVSSQHRKGTSHSGAVQVTASAAS